MQLVDRDTSKCREAFAPCAHHSRIFALPLIYVCNTPHQRQSYRAARCTGAVVVIRILGVPLPKSCSLSIATPLNVVMPSHHVLTILRTCYATNLYVQRSLSISTAPTCHTVISTSCVTAAHSLLCVSTATDRLFVCSCWRVLDLLVSRNSFTIHTTSPFLPVRRELE